MPLNIRKALTDDIEQLTKLINSAYRDQLSRSWTTEKSFVQGNRITIQQLERDLGQENFQLLIPTTSLLAYIFPIQGLWHSTGNLIWIDVVAMSQFIMYVLDVRVELISYYERRGYCRTDRIEAYPIEAEVGQPLVPIQLIEMRKAI